MTKNYEQRAKDFIDKIYPYLNNCKEIMDIEYAVARFNADHNRKVKLSYGSTRVALITSDYVIKFDYNGWGKGRWGSCHSESRMYRQAVKDGYDYLLAKITPYRGQHKRTFYIMPKVAGIERKPCDADRYVCGEEYDWLITNIGDRHNQNYGWKDGHIVMIDYAYNIFTGY